MLSSTHRPLAFAAATAGRIAATPSSAAAIKLSAAASAPRLSAAPAFATSSSQALPFSTRATHSTRLTTPSPPAVRGPAFLARAGAVSPAAAAATTQRSSSSSSGAVPPAHIPIVDFGGFLTGDAEAKRRTSEELVNAFKNVGFVYLSNHGVREEQLKLVYAKSKAFFDLDLEEKMKLEWESPESNRGYVAPGREKVTQLVDPEEVKKLKQASPDLKESLEIGKEPSSTYQNRWPNHDPTFRTELMRFFDTAHGLHMEVMRSLATGLGLPSNYFDTFCDAKDHNLRLLHYPTVEKNLLDKDNQTRAGAHTDYGTVTLLFQDDRGGLQVKTKEGTWAEATPVPGTIVINAGDLLARWSNDVIRSTEHRVVSPPPSRVNGSTAVYPARYSIAFFSNPNMDSVISALPGVVPAGEQPKYPPIKTFDYLVMRLSATY
ncbi:Clavaminate synthase-like protein [Zopfochytrium polystomum]|nr:Clavaminate synthase-like protein [Zopfochytrium polystomum]